MPFTKTQIISRALTILGKAPISTIANAGDVAKVLEEGFDFVYPKIIAQNEWRFPVKIAQLSSILNPNIPDDIPYNYVYQIPTDLLALCRLWPHTLDYQIYEDKIYANIGGSQSFYVEYRFLPVVTALPLYFVDYLAYALAYDYANPITNNDKYIMLIRDKVKEEKAIAMSTDAQQHPNRGILDMPYISVRGGGGARRWPR
jgi:hypothetical protein